MIREWLSEQDPGLWPAVGTVLLVALFIAVIIWVFRPGSRRTYEERARLPLDDGRPEAGERRDPNDSPRREDEHG